MSSALCVFCCDYSMPPVDSSLLRRSCERVGVELHTYGNGRSWPGSYGVAKLLDALEFIKSRSEPLLLYTDSQDSFLVYGADKILEAYARCGAPSVLLQAEKNCYPEAGWANEYPAVDSPWRYICAGGWMGTRSGLIAAMEEILAGEQYRADSFCDQRCWTDWYLRHPNGRLRAELDTNCEVFQSFFLTNDVMDDGFNTVTATRPGVFHFNGRTHGEREWYQGITGNRL